MRKEKGIEKIVISVFMMSILASTACTGSTSTFDRTQEKMSGETIEEKDPSQHYVYSEENFLTKYEKAKDRIREEELSIPKAPTDPGQDGFAIITLDGEVYGVNAMAVLPISIRDLTEEEYLQLADAMQEISGESLLTNKYSIWDEKSSIVRSRDYNWTEQIRLYELEAQYCYENKKPSESLSNDPKKAGPIKIEASRCNDILGTHFLDSWILPLTEMSDEQLLQILEEKYKNASAQHYQPLQEEVSYEKVKELSEKYVLEYKLSETPPEKSYPYYISGRTLENNPPAYIPYWEVRLHFSKGSDCILKINAENGNLMAWRMMPEGTFAESKPIDYLADVDRNEDTHTKEEMIEAAEEFVTETFGKEIVKESSYVDVWDTDNPYYGTIKKVFVTAKEDETFTVYIVPGSLYIYGIKLDDD